MSIPLSISIAIMLGFHWLSFSAVDGREVLLKNESSCPLNLDVLRKLSGVRSALIDVPRHCHYVLEGMRLIRSDYLRATGRFLPPSIASDACWVSYKALISQLVRDFDIESSCGYHPEWISHPCKNIILSSQFEKLIPNSKFEQLKSHCNQNLLNISQCVLCTNTLLSLMSYIKGPENENVSDCTGYPYMYVAALVNQFGPFHKGTAMCLFSFHLWSTVPPSSSSQQIDPISGAVMGFLFGIFGAVSAVFFLLRRHKRRAREKKAIVKVETSFVSEDVSITIGSTGVVKYKYEEIKRATKNFSRENIIGTGKYGNVYRGRFQDGSEVAVKRFKNCSIAGDRTFAHEVEVVASVTHINLVTLRGYCTATIPSQGHHRMILCDLMHNGSLYDHLFESKPKRLSWPIRQKIALGTARGLAYLHYGTQLAIIHRDIKASNILLDKNFEPKVADFGLAKYNSNRVTHLSTRVAGTLGYLAPEYALYGKLTEGSDVYSFGVVMLELLSGKKAVLSTDEGKTSHLTDWAWSLVNEGRALDVIEENMPETGLPEVMEQYVFISVLSCHPHLHARPTMDQIVKLLESKMPISGVSVCSSKAVR